MDISTIAKQLGRKGGLARSKSLSPEEKKRIATRAAQSRWLSVKAMDRISRNLDYAEAVRLLRKPPKVISVSQVNHKLPGIYGNTK